MTERLIESVNMVKELLQSNRQLREIIEKKTQDLEDSQNEVAILQLENQDIKDKMDILSRLVNPSNPDVENSNFDAKKLFEDDGQFAGGLSGGEQLAQEVLSLKKS